MPNIDLNTQLSGLLPFEKYDYVFEGMGGNWPCIITPVSGTIRPYGDSINLDAVVHFCTTKTSCPSGSQGFLTYNEGLCDSNPNLYTTIRLSLKPETLPYSLYSDVKTVSCDNCFDQPSITTPTTITLDHAQGNEYTLTTNIVGLQPNQNYNYSFKSLEANWPVKVTPASGTIKVSKDRINLTNHITFCKNTGLCPVGDSVLDYNVENICFNSKSYHCILQLELDNQDCSLGVVNSNPIAVNCVDCIPRVNINLHPQSNIVVTSTENENGVILTPALSGLKPNTEYSYTYKSLNANYPVYMNPVSGIIKSPASTATLNTQMFFCANTSVCTSGNKGVLDYNLDTVNHNKLNNDLFINLQLELTDINCNESHKSNTLLVYCDNCIPRSDVQILSKSIT